MDYLTFVGIFSLMEDSQTMLNAVGDEREALKKQYKIAESKSLYEVEKTLTKTVNTYRDILIDCIASGDILIDDFDDDLENYLNSHIYNLDDFYEYGYPEDAIDEIKQKQKEGFLMALWSSVVEDDFYNSDSDIQGFINNYPKIDIFMYTVDRYLHLFQ